MEASEAAQYTLALRRGATLADRYRIGRVLTDSSTFALTYLAYDASAAEGTHSSFAIKEFLPRVYVGRARDGRTVQPHSPTDEREFSRALRRFLHEGGILADAASPYLVRVQRCLEANGTGYLVMEPRTGQLLPTALTEAGGRLAPHDAVTLVLRVLEAVERIHAEGVVHRAISPLSVDVSETWEPLLHGFSARRHISGQSPEFAPGFAAFEQYASRDVGPWTDVYACAALLYYLVTGATPPAAIDRAAGQTLAPAGSLVPDLSPALSLAIARGMSLLPEQRPHGAAEFRKQLETVSGDAATSTSPYFGHGGGFDASRAAGVGGVGPDDPAALQLAAGGRLVIPRDETVVPRFVRMLGNAADRVREGLRSTPSVPSITIPAARPPLAPPAPVPAAPTARTPVTPAAAATPVMAAPVAPTPVVTTPVATTPVATTPVATTPVATTSVERPPVAAAPVAPTPAVETPVAATPIVVTPATTTPVTTTPVATSPVASTPERTAPMSIAAAAATLALATPEVPVEEVTPTPPAPGAAIPSAASPRPEPQRAEPAPWHSARYATPPQDPLPAEVQLELVRASLVRTAPEVDIPPVLALETYTTPGGTALELQLAEIYEETPRPPVTKYAAAAVITLVLIGSAYALFGNHGDAGPVRVSSNGTPASTGTSAVGAVGAAGRVADAGGSIQQSARLANDSSKGGDRRGTAASEKGAGSGKTASTPKESGSSRDGSSNRESSNRESPNRESSNRESDRESSSGSTSSLPKIQSVAVSAPTFAGKKPVPIDVVMDLRTRLTNGKEQVEQGEYALARRIYRTGLTSTDKAIAEYAESESLRSIRGELDLADRRALRACEAENEVTKKRGGRPVPCE